jgi:hypothetical protein
VHDNGDKCRVGIDGEAWNAICKAVAHALRRTPVALSITVTAAILDGGIATVTVTLSSVNCATSRGNKPIPGAITRDRCR